ncbi:MAG: hypothetical protein ABIW76_05375 [Fibrobacteria bacterium]
MGRNNPNEKAKVLDYYQYTFPPELDEMTYGIAESLAMESRTLDRDDSLLLLFYQNKFDRFFDAVYSRGDSRVSQVFREQVEEAQARSPSRIPFQAEVESID